MPKAKKYFSPSIIISVIYYILYLFIFDWHWGKTSLNAKQIENATMPQCILSFDI